MIEVSRRVARHWCELECFKGCEGRSPIKIYYIVSWINGGEWLIVLINCAIEWLRLFGIVQLVLLLKSFFIYLRDARHEWKSETRVTSWRSRRWKADVKDVKAKETKGKTKFASESEFEQFKSSRVASKMQLEGIRDRCCEGKLINIFQHRFIK